MRIVIDSLVAVMLAGVLAGIVMFDRSVEAHDLAIEQTRESLTQIGRELQLQAALGQTELTKQGHPRMVDPEWFEISLPRNALLADRNLPWLEVAGPRDRALTHPAIRTATDGAAATFWYNPYRGIVRARVPDGLSDATSITTYNRVNGTSIDSLFAQFREDD